MKNKISFASETYNGVHHKILEAISEANVGQAYPYGDDSYTVEAKKILLDEFQGEELFFAYNGTAANVLAIDSVLDKYHAILCASTAHINTHETGAPTRMSACPIFYVESSDGKFNIEKAKSFLKFLGNKHHSQAKLISISQITELGTVYTNEEVKAIADFAHENNMLLHMDGARLCNASISLGKSLKEITKDVGVDILSFGGTKNGLMFGEAVIFFNKKYNEGIDYLIKQNLQLNSKMRFLSCQFIPYIKEGLCYENAKNANKMAKLLEEKLSLINGIEITQKVEANMIYLKLPSLLIEKLKEEFLFYPAGDNEIRLVTSFETKEVEVLEFVEKIKLDIG